MYNLYFGLGHHRYDLVKIQKRKVNRLQKDKDAISESRAVDMRDFEIASKVRNTATTCSNNGSANMNLSIPSRLHHDLSINNLVNINPNISRIPMDISQNVSSIHLEWLKKNDQHLEGAGTIGYIIKEEEQ